MNEQNPSKKFSSEELQETTPESGGDIMREHIVEEKDTLPDIAKRYGLSLDEIKNANKDKIHSDADMVQPGTRLLIPNKERE